jgi:hypothetical protein
MEDSAPAASPSKPPARRGHAAHSARPRKTKAETAAAASQPAVTADTPQRKTTPVRAPRKPKAPSVAKTAVPASVQNVPLALPEFRIDHQAIAALAYSYWEERGRTGGSPQEDWYRAEQELLRMREMYLEQAS